MGAIGEKSYGEFNLNSWEKRTAEEHREQMNEITACSTAQAQNKLESEYGTRFSVLAYLEYFDTIRMNIVDPMHHAPFVSWICQTFVEGF